MIRIVIENVLLFLLPAAIYFGYVYLRYNDKPDKVASAWDEAPLFALAGAGIAMIAAFLVVFGSFTETGKPGDRYTPPVLKDGKIQPGRLNDP
ncbi:MAG: DUF6111 family protein [Pseudomonadota bacterium]